MEIGLAMRPLYGMDYYLGLFRLGHTQAMCAVDPQKWQGLELMLGEKGREEAVLVEEVKFTKNWG